MLEMYTVTELSYISTFLQFDYGGSAQMMNFYKMLRVMQLDEANSISFICLIYVPHLQSHSKALYNSGYFIYIYE